MADDETTREVDALGALEAWLLTEDAYARGAIADEVLNYMQDTIHRLLGPHALDVAGDFLRRHAEGGGDLAGLARDRSALGDLLALIEGKRRKGFEMEWSAEPAGRPAALLVMAEYGVGDPVWERPRGSGEPVSLSEFDVTDSLVHRLRAWNEAFEQSALDDGWAGSEAFDVWVRQGLVLAHELQREVPDVDVRYFHADDDRPLRSL